MKSHSTCEHSFSIRCGLDPSSHDCKEPCGTNLICCGQRCASTCGKCQQLSRNGVPEASLPIPRIRHQSHPCRRRLFCGHQCQTDCSEDHTCTTQCVMPCRQRCEHSVCKQRCHEVCAPCAEPCSWTCPHRGRCPVPCGSVCARLPCNLRCSRILSCGHQCPSCELYPLYMSICLIKCGNSVRGTLQYLRFLCTLRAQG